MGKNQNTIKTSKYSKTIAAYDALGKKYLADTINSIPSQREVFLQALKPNSKILDLGCGGGRDVKEFVKQKHLVVGVDMSQVMLDEAKRRVPTARFYKMSAAELKFPKNSFDAIWAEAVLLHLTREDAYKAFLKMYSILKPGGVLYVAVKKGQGEKFVSEKLSGHNERFYTYFSIKEVEGLFKELGLKIAFSEMTTDIHGRADVKWIRVMGIKPESLTHSRL